MDALISEREVGRSRRASGGEAMRRAGPREIEAALTAGRREPESIKSMVLPQT